MKKTPDNNPEDAADEAARRRDIDALIRAAGLNPEILDDEQTDEGQG